MHILAIDVGTSSVKAAVLDQPTGEPASHPARAEYDLDHPTPDAAEVPADRPKAVLCAGGLRSSTTISALKRLGIQGWYNVTGGMGAWTKSGYPVARS